jgi:excisionase family DNA binding protein
MQITLRHDRCPMACVRHKLCHRPRVSHLHSLLRKLKILLVILMLPLGSRSVFRAKGTMDLVPIRPVQIAVREGQQSKMHQLDRVAKSTPCERESVLSLGLEPFLTTAAVSRWLGVSTRTLCLWAECKEIPAVKIGRQWRFRESELRRWLEGQRASKMKNHSDRKASSTRFAESFFAGSFTVHCRND